VKNQIKKHKNIIIVYLTNYFLILSVDNYFMNIRNNQDNVLISSGIEKRFKSYPKCIRKLLIYLANHLPKSIFNIGKVVLSYVDDHKYLLKMYYKIPPNGGINNKVREKKIIISLTTIPSRINYVPYILGSMLRQTVKPDMVILNLGEELFSNMSIPPSINKFEAAGVTIQYVPDLKPHTKYYYTLKNYPDDIIITVDDDIIYPLDFIEKLYQSYLEYPYAISCYRAHMMMFNDQGNLLPYNEWIKEYSESNKPSMRLFATGVGGILYPPHCMHREVLNKDALLSLSPRADDVWLKMMQVMNNCPIVVIKHLNQYVGVARSKTQEIALYTSNVGNNENDLQIQMVLDNYNNYLGTSDTLLMRMQS